MNNRIGTLGQRLTKNKAIAAIIVILVVMIFFDVKFYTVYNLVDYLRTVSVIVIIGLGVSLTVISGGCDLSVGGMMSLSGILAILLIDYMPMPLAILIAVAAGAVVGFINGFFAVHQKTEPFIITLGVGALLKGICLQLTNARPIACKNPVFMKIANEKLFGTVPYIVIYMLVFLFLTHYILRYTQFGRNCYAVGGDRNVAAYSGINVVRTQWLTYVLSGLFSAIAGVLLSSRMNTGSSVFGDATALLVHCGIAVGGTSLAGGIGGAFESFSGLLVLQLLSNGMSLLGIKAYLQQASRGLIIIAILWLNYYEEKRKRETV